MSQTDRAWDFVSLWLQNISERQERKGRPAWAALAWWPPWMVNHPKSNKGLLCSCWFKDRGRPTTWSSSGREEERVPEGCPCCTWFLWPRGSPCGRGSLPRSLDWKHNSHMAFVISNSYWKRKPPSGILYFLSGHSRKTQTHLVKLYENSREKGKKELLGTQTLLMGTWPVGAPGVSNGCLEWDNAEKQFLVWIKKEDKIKCKPRHGYTFTSLLNVVLLSK